MNRTVVERRAVSIEVSDDGKGVPIVLLPSLGRSSGDFDGIVSILSANFRTIRPQPRGIGGSIGPISDTTMVDWAGDIAEVIRTLAPDGAIVAGHGFGNFVARFTAALWPDRVLGVAMLSGSPGRVPGRTVVYAPDVMAAIKGSSDLSLPDGERVGHLRKAFFASKSDPTVWLGGWSPDVKAAQIDAYFRTKLDLYFGAGKAPILQLQAIEDAVAPMEFSHVMRDELGERVTRVLIPDAAHALLPEQPAAVAGHLAGWIGALGIKSAH
jgi:pimeloyl-ACP methyl ester carboxylesterase